MFLRYNSADATNTRKAVKTVDQTPFKRKGGNRFISQPPISLMVPKPGFEPGQAYTHQTLNLARLPIPPLRQSPHVRNFAPIYTGAPAIVK